MFVYGFFPTRNDLIFWGVVYFSFIFWPDPENKTSDSVQKPLICSIDKLMNWQRKLKIVINQSIKTNPDISAYFLKPMVNMHALLASFPIYVSSKWRKHLISKRGLSQGQFLAVSLLLEDIFLLGSPTKISHVD